MLRTAVKKGSYHDSVVLMLLTNQISMIQGVKKASVMMAPLQTRISLSRAGWIQRN